MVNLILLLIIRSIDLPILEEYPFVFLNLKNDILKNLNSHVFINWICGGKKLFDLEINYTLNVGSYEYLLLSWLRKINSRIPTNQKIWFDISLILTTLYMWWFNIGFVVGSVLLPVVFYYFFLLMDYYEVMEEFIQIIKEKLKN